MLLPKKSTATSKSHKKNDESVPSGISERDFHFCKNCEIKPGGIRPGGKRNLFGYLQVCDCGGFVKAVHPLPGAPALGVLINNWGFY